MKNQLTVIALLLFSLSFQTKIISDAQEISSGSNSYKNERENDSNQNSRLCKNKCRQPGEKCVIGVGNTVTCQTVCGDKLTAGSEQCDDGNTNNGDGCSNTCQVEYDWSCAGQPSVCTNLCGNLKWDSGEQCQYTFMFNCSLSCHQNTAIGSACRQYKPEYNPPPYYNTDANETFVCNDLFGFGCQNCLIITPNFKCGFIDSVFPTNYLCGLTCPATSSKEIILAKDVYQLFLAFMELAIQKYYNTTDFFSTANIITVQQMINLLKANNIYSQLAFNNFNIDISDQNAVINLGLFFIVQGFSLFSKTMTTSSSGIHIFTIYYPKQKKSFFNYLAKYINNNEIKNDPNAEGYLESIKPIMSCIGFKMIPVDPSKLV